MGRNCDEVESKSDANDADADGDQGIEPGRAGEVVPSNCEVSLGDSSPCQYLAKGCYSNRTSGSRS